MTKLRLYMMFLVFGISALFLSFFVYSAQKTAYKSLEEHGRLIAYDLAAESELGVLAGDISFIKKPLERKLSYKDVIYVFICDKDGNVLLEKSKLSFSLSLNLKRLSGVTIGNVESDIINTGNLGLFEFITPIVTVDMGEEDFFFGDERPAPHKNKENGKKNAAIRKGKHIIGYVCIILSMAQARADINSIIQMGLFVTLSFILIGIVITYVLAKELGRPISHLTDSVRDIKNGNLDQDIVLQSNDEFSELAGSFNEMRQTLKIRLEELKQARLQAEYNSRVKSEFLANMSHEIRTPMNGIIGFTDILLENKPQKEQKDSLGIIKNSAVNLLGIINDILDISKIESQRLTLEEVDFDIEVLVYDICNLFKFKATNSIEVTASVEDIPAMLVGDPTRLRQIITNLVGNACKFTETGEVSVKASLVKENKSSFELEFSVHDTGIGIPDDKLCTIFDPFSQADGSTTRRFGGTGLGLSISKQLSEMMGGRMWVESELGVGSTFYFTATFKKAHHRYKSAPIRFSALLGKHGLVIDNDKNALRITAGILQEFGVKPITFEDSKLAIDYLRGCETLPDFAIIDMVMPKNDGLEFVKTIRKNDRLSEIPMIIHASDSYKGAPETCKKLGFVGYLPKPTLKLPLLRVICSVLGLVDKKEEKIVTQHSAKEDVLRNSYILLVEDNLINQKLIFKMLNKMGCKIDVANDGLIAVKKLREKNAYNIVFMDVQMPNMGGLEATKEIRKLGKKIPIIAMTANAMTGDRDECIKAGMNDYISKPINKGEVVAKIEEWGEL